ncbi:MAG TPA: MiaB/RimO family radical SAM methylthiotransferase [Gordonibacter urolithinfaciens]|uniref:MiaB/RimO family radical SAM methylthiotransferase n=1 Tax=Gordonibacter urolithinfaciens TaxID=1335613 RepID=A0A6N8IFF2_9ACTN|nr:MiaB/RimO family radical SAM methylthiotransferase [Gordonibacter urolithinfaciens]MVM54933.1 MiaB/RimO family radical SAM methylthiotransferase [Gordonibacter urolithinfaciens]MVN14555.1 MiaB/RimO family radical SAM methylthiotransferase [Gordonibacter urolithinfaciens]MVN40158.1 MiaB/RimO family radical SAM methylthiotransferase [Gordonibacter urolithinfaciens]MVN57283.1 MiaB/RimO family radical SAM methylthiotransferase [Gordonibacter urolithinfaciens]MVN62547.1 MiaB/RimO family radical 
MNFAVVNLGCKVNRVESDDAAARLAACGVETPEAEADLIVVNTCTVTGEAEKKTRKAVRRALRANDRARVLVTGCAAAIDAAFYEALGDRVTVVGKAQLADAIRDWCEACSSRSAAGEPADLANVPAVQAEGPAGLSRGAARGASETACAPIEQGDVAPLLHIGSGFRNRVGVKVQDGCDNACTYCIVHVARGRATSRPADEVVRECAAYARAGAGEIVLTGINLGSYCDGGRRDPSATRLAGLLRRLLDETADLHGPGALPVRFRISSVEPRDVDDALIDLLAVADGRVCRHLHLPLQAGSSKVLREMARPYDAERFRVLVERLYAAVPELALSTDIIAGFPGETDAEFQETLALARACRFAKIHAFPYSRRAGTPAAARADQVPAEVKAARAAALRALGDELRASERARRVGTVELALVEEGGVAMSESYFELPAPVGAPLGTLVKATM